jgi:hypothetical protein
VVAVKNNHVVGMRESKVPYFVKRHTIASPLYTHTGCTQDNLIQSGFDFSEVRVPRGGDGRVSGFEQDIVHEDHQTTRTLVIGVAGQVGKTNAIVDIDLVVGLRLEKLDLGAVGCAQCVAALIAVQWEAYRDTLSFFKDQGNVQAKGRAPCAEGVVLHWMLRVQQHRFQVLERVRARGFDDLLQNARHLVQPPHVADIDDIHGKHEF